MKLLLDENLPHRLRQLLPGHEAYTVQFMDWNGYANGRLLALAADDGFDALITMDANLEYQQNLATLPCRVFVLLAPDNDLPTLLPLLPNLLRR